MYPEIASPCSWPEVVCSDWHKPVEGNLWAQHDFHGHSHRHSIGAFAVGVHHQRGFARCIPSIVIDDNGEDGNLGTL
jgi:hypothetical protein